MNCWTHHFPDRPTEPWIARVEDANTGRSRWAWGETESQAIERATKAQPADDDPADSGPPGP